MTDREYRSDSGLSERYTTRIPMATGGDRSSYRSDYMTENVGTKNIRGTNRRTTPG